MQWDTMTVGQALRRSAQLWPDQEFVIDGERRITYAAFDADVDRLACGLWRLGVGRGDHVACWLANSAWWLLTWFACCRIGASVVSINTRYKTQEVAYILRQSDAKALVAMPRYWEIDYLSMIGEIAPGFETAAVGALDCDAMPALKAILLWDDASHPGTQSLTALMDGPVDAEALAAAEAAVRTEDPLIIIYTSGTTGNPKGVVYTHRSNVLHALAASGPDCLNLTSRDTLMPVVPLFHANGWSIAYTAPMNGAAMVMPGRDMTPAGLYEMLEMGVTLTAAVPTIWLGMLQYLKAENKTFSTLERVVIGGSSCPRAVIEAFQNRYGVRVFHAWGMTETSPLGTVASFKPEVAALPPEEQLDVQTMVGHPPFTVDLRITDDDGAELPWDGKTQGKLWIRGPGVVRRYLKKDEDAAQADGWFDTGDVATMDENAYVRITDRSKDVIKSGGEWISSIDMENAAVAHPGVAEAAAIGVPHPKWDERPILVVVKAPGEEPDPAEIVDYASKGLAKWQRPDDVVFVDELPHTATGKISKLHLRQRLQEMDYKLPELR